MGREGASERETRRASSQERPRLAVRATHYKSSFSQYLTESFERSVCDADDDSHHANGKPALNHHLSCAECMPLSSLLSTLSKKTSSLVQSRAFRSSASRPSLFGLARREAHGELSPCRCPQSPGRFLSSRLLPSPRSFTSAVSPASHVRQRLPPRDQRQGPSVCSLAHSAQETAARKLLESGWVASELAARSRAAMLASRALRPPRPQRARALSSARPAGATRPSGYEGLTHCPAHAHLSAFYSLSTTT